MPRNLAPKSSPGLENLRDAESAATNHDTACRFCTISSLFCITDPTITPPNQLAWSLARVEEEIRIASSHSKFIFATSKQPLSASEEEAYICWEDLARSNPRMRCSEGMPGQQYQQNRDATPRKDLTKAARRSLYSLSPCFQYCFSPRHEYSLVFHRDSVHKWCFADNLRNQLVVGSSKFVYECRYCRFTTGILETGSRFHKLDLFR